MAHKNEPEPEQYSERGHGKLHWPFSTIYNKVVAVFKLLREIKELVLESRDESNVQFEHVHRRLHKIEQRLKDIETQSDDADLANAARESLPIIESVVNDLNVFTPEPSEGEAEP